MTTRRIALVDLNVLMALAWPQHVHHGRAHSWFETASGDGWATTPVTESGFIRLSLNPVVVGVSLSAGDVLGALQQMRTLTGHRFLPDDASLGAPVISLVRLSTARQVADLHLVNLARRHGAVLATLDKSIPDYVEAADRDAVLVLP
jgi:uncharacterized protein